jgi:hypothetical protein
MHKGDRIKYSKILEGDREREHFPIAWNSEFATDSASTQVTLGKLKDLNLISSYGPCK